ncbi:MAG: acyl-CoA thioesterase [Bacteroidetes bacterium]|jgi:acyl-CoA thioester hydrolase|nr:acyl-CoA thioesterase [Bacteroidota bacterium]
MIYTETKLRVRYAETDQMGFVYYGHYAQYFEVARTDWVRSLGTPYRDFEHTYGVMLPVLELQVNYKKAATYDDVLTIRTYVREQPGIKIRFEHEIVNEAGEVLVTGHVVLVFVNKETMKPCRPPAFFLEQVAHAWKAETSLA